MTWPKWQSISTVSNKLGVGSVGYPTWTNTKAKGKIGFDGGRERRIQYIFPLYPSTPNLYIYSFHLGQKNNAPNHGREPRRVSKTCWFLRPWTPVLVLWNNPSLPIFQVQKSEQREASGGGITGNPTCCSNWKGSLKKSITYSFKLYISLYQDPKVLASQ